MLFGPGRLRSRESWRYGDRKECRGSGGLERGTSFGEVRAPYLQATPADQKAALAEIHASCGPSLLTPYPTFIPSFDLSLRCEIVFA